MLRVQGWGCKGLFLGGPGNTSNGGGLVQGNFGEKVAAGSVVGVLVEPRAVNQNTRSVAVTFYQDGRCLGQAFDSSMQDPDAEIFPVVRANDDGDAFTISMARPAPAARTREPQSGGGGGGGGGGQHPAVGTWELTELYVGPELGQVPFHLKMGGQPIKLTIKAPDPRQRMMMMRGGGKGKGGGGGGGPALGLSMKVVNNLGCELSCSSDPSSSLAPFVPVTVGPVRSTKMMGPPDMMVRGLKTWHILRP